jgi:hypothetical protein
MTRSAAIAGAADLVGMLVVELELGGWSPGRRRSPARRARRHARGRARRLVTRSTAIAGAAGAAELAGMLVVELIGVVELGRARRSASMADADDLSGVSLGAIASCYAMSLLGHDAIAAAICCILESPAT